MRLLQTIDGYTFSLTKNFLGDDEIPAYAILSHTWQADQEVTFDDLTKDNKNGLTKVRASLRRLRPHASKAGYTKLRFCGQQAKRDGLDYFWVDTCCINKADHVELQEAINSMFRWYRDAAKCYVFLSDVSVAGHKESADSSAWEADFARSRWFTRGWTLQEMLAPSNVNFYTKEGYYLGDRAGLQRQIQKITNIPASALSGAALAEFSVNERLSWVERRHTTREEDKVYSMLGIFNVQMTLRYGEQYGNALRRLHKKILKSQVASTDLGRRPDHIVQATVPFPRDNDFIPRDSLDIIRKTCARPGARAALIGLGGVGKSQIAIEYTYQVLEESSKTWVFWVHAATQERFIEGFQKIADTIKMDGWNEPKVNVMRLVRTWLCEKSNGSWVMVVDNADDASVFFDNAPQSKELNTSKPVSTEPLAAFLPRTSHGSILITSRSRDIAYRLIGTETSIVEIGSMNEREALALLRKKFSHAVKEDEALSLVQTLDYMPLALTQAAALISLRKPRMSVSKYIGLIHKSDWDRGHLLSQDLADNRRDDQARNSITTAWQISFEYIGKQTPSAARLLSLMSFFDRQEIPDTLLQDWYGNGIDAEANFEDDIYTLSSFSFIKTNADGSCFEMHRLVQLSTKMWLERCDELMYWKEIYVAHMDKNYPVCTPETLSVCRALLPHAQAAIENLPKDADALEAWASLSIHVARYLDAMGDHSRAYKLALDSFDVREILLGADDPFTLDSLNTLSMILDNLGRYDEAKAMHKKALEAKERTCGANDPSTLVSMINLASAYNAECQWIEAEKLVTQALETCRSALEPGHRLIDSALALLATLHSNQGRWAEAVKIRQQLLKTRETHHGPGDPNTLSIKNNLAYTLHKQGFLKEAEELQLQVVESCKEKPEPGTDLLIYQAQLALIYKAQSRFEEAERLQIQTLDASKKMLGPDHLSTTTHMSDLAGTYWIQGRFEEAHALDIQVLDIRTAKLGHDHLLTLESTESLAITYESQGRLSEAEKMKTEVFNAHKEKLGADHPWTLRSMSSLASTYRSQERFAEAEELGSRAWKTSIETLGPDHPDTLQSMNGLAVTYKAHGRMGEACELMGKCYEAKRRVLGEEHSLTVLSKELWEGWKSADVKQ